MLFMCRHSPKLEMKFDCVTKTKYECSSVLFLTFGVIQIASFIKTHIFSRRRPIDGWKYMIEEIGPNSRKGKGSVSRLPSVSDESTQPFREEKVNFVASYPSNRGR